MKHKFVCPWWMGYLLANPLRRLVHNPDEIISPYLRDGARILEIGPGMGFFTIPMARMVGDKGKVYCVDIQQKMLNALTRRVAKAGLSGIIETRLSSEHSFGVKDLAGSIDFALLFAVVHEVPDQQFLISEVYQSLRKGGTLLLSEPSGHVKRGGFDETINIAERTGFSVIEEPEIRGEYSVLLIR